MKTVQLAVHIPTFLLGLLLNLLAIRGFSTFLRKRRWPDYAATAIYMINLAIFDLLLVLSLPFKMALANVRAPLPSLCTLVECFYFISMYGSVFTICFISLDRFLAIRFPFLVSHLRSPRKIFGICCTIWVLVWAGSIPIYSFHGKMEKYTCFHNMSDGTWSAQVFFPRCIPPKPRGTEFQNEGEAGCTSTRWLSLPPTLSSKTAPSSEKATSPPLVSAQRSPILYLWPGPQDPVLVLPGGQDPAPAPPLFGSTRRTIVLDRLIPCPHSRLPLVGSRHSQESRGAPGRPDFRVAVTDSTLGAPLLPRPRELSG
uniref:G-protein coupled receptors family 1 profile domain-containing protein n=1 Tax=Canis lupus familiaris TaxID=9615 RepID=A0A8C0TJZ5_CANLF